MLNAFPELIIPTGTQVVAPDANTAAYRVRCADGAEALLHRAELSIRKEHQRAGLGAEQPDLHWSLGIVRCAWMDAGRRCPRLPRWAGAVLPPAPPQSNAAFV